MTVSAFGQYRNRWAPDQDMHPEAKRYEGDTDQLQPSEGLRDWVDGHASSPQSPPIAPVIENISDKKVLWAVTADAVFHADEKCPFGADRGAGVIKHSNLTGGGKAFSAGELIFLDENTVVINGCSGRYRIRKAAELEALASAFKASGYNVWTMGYDDDTNRPVTFGVQDPVWVVK